MKAFVMMWPESQCLFEKKGFRSNTKLINGEEGLDKFGSSAYLVDEDWFNNTTTTTEDEDTDMEIEICYDDELRDLGFLHDEED